MVRVRNLLAVQVGAAMLTASMALASEVLAARGIPAEQAPVAPGAASDSAVSLEASNLIWRIDIAVQRAMRVRRADGSPGREAVFRALNWWGGTGVIVFAALLWLGGRALGRYPVSRIGLRGAEGIAVASALSGITKGLAGRSRPFLAPGEPWQWDFNHGWSDARYFSMPSGHTTATVAFAVAAAIAAWRTSRTGGGAFGAIMLMSAACVGLARMYADQHWLSDIMAAGVLGTATSLVLAGMHARTPAAAYHRVMLGVGAVDAGRSR